LCRLLPHIDNLPIEAANVLLLVEYCANRGSLLQPPLIRCFRWQVKFVHPVFGPLASALNQRSVHNVNLCPPWRQKIDA